jgi:hypothetical protein
LEQRLKQYIYIYRSTTRHYTYIFKNLTYSDRDSSQSDSSSSYSSSSKDESSDSTSSSDSSSAKRRHHRASKKKSSKKPSSSKKHKEHGKKKSIKDTNYHKFQHEDPSTGDLQRINGMAINGMTIDKAVPPDNM